MLSLMFSCFAVKSFDNLVVSLIFDIKKLWNCKCEEEITCRKAVFPFKFSLSRVFHRVCPTSCQWVPHDSTQHHRVWHTIVTIQPNFVLFFLDHGRWHGRNVLFGVINKPKIHTHNTSSLILETNTTDMFEMKRWKLEVHYLSTPYLLYDTEEFDEPN